MRSGIAKTPRSKLRKIPWVLVVAVITLIAAVAGPLAPAGAENGGTTFTVVIENVSNEGTLSTSAGSVAVPLSPGAYVVHKAGRNKLLDPRDQATPALEALAEDGDPSGFPSQVPGSKVFNTPVGADGPGPLLPGQTYSFSFDAKPGYELSLATMFVQSNDWFYTTVSDTHGIGLFDAAGNPVSGDVTDQLKLWESKTEVDEEPGTGSNQAPRQSGPNTGPTESGQVISLSTQGKSAKLNGPVIKVTIHVDGTTPPVEPPSPPVEPPVEPPFEPPTPSLSAVDTLEADGRFTTLLAAFDASFLTPPPEGQLFTLLAPTDEAFAALPPGLLDDLLANPGFLTDVLAYHLIEGAVPAETVVTLTEARSALGAPIGIEVVDGTVVLNGSVNVIETDIFTTEGIIHVLDGVLELPPPPDQVGFLRAGYARGSTEVPDPGDPDALSNAFVDILDTGDEATLEVCVFIETTIEDPTMAHIHRGAAGEAGSVEVDFDFSADSWDADEFNPSQRFFAQGCVDVDLDLAFELLDRPSEFYVNIHSVGSPAGANREQLIDGDIDDPRAFTAAPLLGSNEVPGPGDADSGRNWVDLYRPTTDTGELCYTSQVFRVDEITSGHIHTGAAGVAGDVLVDLEYGARWKLLTHPSGQGYFVWGCVAITADALAAIEAEPAGHYVNLHNETFPAGAIRSQLVAGVGETLRFAELAPADGQSNDLFGFANMALFPTQGLLCWDTPNAGIGQPTAMTISDAGGVVVEFDLVTHPMLADVLDPFVEFTSFGCQTVADETLQGLVDNPNDYTMSMDSAAGAGALTGVVFDPTVGPPPPEPPPDGDRPDVIPLPNGFQPEGVAVGQGTDLFVGSLGRLGDDGATVTGGAIYKADAATGQGAVLVEAKEGKIAVGLTVDARTNYVWVAGGPFGTANVYDGATGDEVAEFVLVDVPPFETLVNDVILAGDAAYFTDSFRPSLYRVPLDSGGALPDPIVVEEIPLGDDFPFTAGGINANGIVAPSASGALIISHLDLGQLFRIDLATGAATQIDLGGVTLTGPDGLVLDGSTLYVVENSASRISVIELSGDLASGTVTGVITSPDFRFPATADQLGDDLYAVNARFDVAPPPFPGSPPLDPNTEFEIVRVSKSDAVPPPGIVTSVVKAPIVPDGNVAGADTDFVITLDRSLDPSVDGRSLAAGDTIRITLPEEFINNGLDTGSPGSPGCVPGPCNVGVLLQGWPQHPIAPPAANYSLALEGTHTIVYTALKDLGPAGPENPGIKQIHLILVGFSNPAAGDYDIVVEAQTGEGGAVETGTGTITILPEITPSINITSAFNDGTPITIYQTTAVGQSTPLAYDFLLFDATGGPMTGVTLENGDLMQNGAKVGSVTISSPDGATGQSVTVAEPSIEVNAPVLGFPAGRLTAVFTAGSVEGDYEITFSLDGGTSVTMFVEAIAATAAR